MPQIVTQLGQIRLVSGMVRFLSHNYISVNLLIQGGHLGYEDPRSLTMKYIYVVPPFNEGNIHFHVCLGKNFDRSVLNRHRLIFLTMLVSTLSRVHWLNPNHCCHWNDLSALNAAVSGARISTFLIPTYSYCISFNINQYKPLFFDFRIKHESQKVNVGYNCLFSCLNLNV